MAKLDTKEGLDETLVLALEVASREIRELKLRTRSLEAELALLRTPPVSKCKHLEAYIASTYGYYVKVLCDTCGGKNNVCADPYQRLTNEEIIVRGRKNMGPRKRIWGS